MVHGGNENQRLEHENMISRLNDWRTFLAAGLLVVFGAAAGCGAVATDPSRIDDPSRDAEGGAVMPPEGRAVEYATEETFDRLVLQSDLPVLVDFYADWCPPCQTLAPILEEFARETTHARVVKVNVDEQPELARRYGVEVLPTLIVFEDGQPSPPHRGFATKPELKALVGG
jgi:thioredoxin 1